jgi:hypothetical protein
VDQSKNRTFAEDAARVSNVGNTTPQHQVKTPYAARPF